MLFYLVIKTFKGSAVMQISCVDIIADDPSVSVTGRLNGVGEDLFVFAFVKPAAFRVGCTYFDFPYLF